MKVVHIGEYVKGGIETYLNQVIQYQVDNNVDVYLIMSNQFCENNFDLDENHIFRYNYERNKKYYIKTITTIKKIIDEIEPDIVHIHSTFAGFFVRLPLFFRKRKYKVVYCSHGWSFLMDISDNKKRIYAFIEKILSKKTDVIINISKDEFNKSMKYGLPKKKSILIYNGIKDFEENSNKYETIRKPNNIRIDNTKINLLFVGRFDKQKGLDILLEFFKDYGNEKIQLFTIGERVLGEQILLSKNVHNLGWIDNKLIDDYYKLFDAIIMPSRWEGFGLVAIEAMKNSKPVICSNRGALPELVREEINGYLFDIDNLDSLEEILNKTSKEELRKRGLRGNKIYKEKFTSDIMNKQIMNVYFQLKNNE